MLRRTLLRGFLQGDVLAPLVFVLILCVPQVLSQSPGNPTIVAPSSALEGSTVNFTCSSIGGNPLPAVTWYRGNTIVDQTYDTSTVGSVTVTTNNFQFTVYRNDSGVSYRCEVNNVNLGSPLTKTWYMTIYVQPGAPTISGPSVVTAGSTYTHRCVTSSGGIPVPTLAWKLGTQSLDNLGISNQVTTLSDNTNIVENNVTWVPVASDNGKTLSCELSHNETLGTSKLTDSIVMTVQVLPNISTTVTSYSRTVGTSVTLQCSILAASPSVTSVYWTRLVNSQTTTISIDGSKYTGSSTSNPSLTINPLATTDAGVYTCNAVNSAGTGSGQGILLSVSGSAPTVSIPSSSYPVSYNSNTTLICSVTSTPNATAVNWYRVVNNVDTFLSISGNSRLSGGTTSNPSLTVTFAIFSDEGSYKCEATNSVGTTRSTPTFLDVIGSSPNVSIPISSYSAVFGNSVTIACTVTANPSATSVSWQQIVNSQSTTINVNANPTKYSGSTTSTPSLTINSLVTADSGYYVCSATNAAGTTVSGQTYLNVTGTTPTVSANPTSYSQNYGTNATLQCSVSGNPSVNTVYWTKTRNGVTTNITTGTAQSSSKYSGVNTGNPSLQIISLTTTDGGTYVCFGVNSVGSSQSSAVTLNVIGDAPTVSIPLTSYSALIGTNIQFPCSISANPTTTSVYWIFNPSNSANNVQISQSTGRYTVSQATNSPALTITNVTFSDTGSYTCTAVNVVGTGTDTADFNVTGSSPSVSIAQSSYSVLTGNSITIPCTISATPAISTRYWIFDPSGTGNNVQISTSTGRYTLGANTNSPSLTISNAVTSDAGTYTCYATNLVGTTADSATLTLTGDEPNITISVTSYSVLLNANVTLTCEVPAAQPSVNSVAWRFRTQGSSSTSEIDIAGNPNTYSGGSLNTPSLTITQVGNDQEGYYICTATNLVGTGNGTEIFLNVSGSGPSVSIPSSSYSVLQTQTVSLQCNVNNASPQITAVTWYYSATNNNASPSVVDIAGNSRYTGGTTTSPSLNITNAQSGDAGYYRCSATNAVATATSGYTSLSVTGAIPSGTSISGDASQSVDQTNTLTLTCSASGDPTPTITWSFNGQTLSSTNGVYTKVNVQRADDGEYTCTATNSLGSQTDTVDVDVRFAPVATSSAVSINAATGSTQTLTCAVEANPGVTYQWTRNSQVVGTNSRTYSKTFGTGDFGDYICTATNTLGTATVTFTVSQSSAGAVGAATAGGGLTTGEIAAIVLAVLLILLLIIVICICCCTHGVCGAICGKKKDPKGRVEPVKEKEVYKETIRHIEIPRFEEKPKVREHSAVSRRDVDVNVKRENDYDIVRYETVPPAYYGDTIIAVQDDVRPSPRPHRLPALTTTEYTYEEAERRRKHRRKKKKHRRRHDDEEVIVEKVRSASPVRIIEEVAPVRVIEEPAETVVKKTILPHYPDLYL